MTSAIFGGAPPDDVDERSDITRVPCSDLYEPTVDDVLAVKQELLNICGFPIELVDAVIDFAEYWPHTSVRRKGSSGEEHRIRSNVIENDFLLRSYPLGYVPNENDVTDVDWATIEYPTIAPRPWIEDKSTPKKVTKGLVDKWSKNIRASGATPCRKIVFTIKSHDQGWGGGATHRGSYYGSYTWFDVGKERLCAFDDRNMPPSIISQDEGAQSENDDEVVVDRMVGGIPKIHTLPHFRVPAPDEKVPEGADPEPIVCTTKTVIPEVKRYKEGENEGKCYIDQDLMPTLQCLQRNVTADRNFKEYKITWSCQDNIDCDSEEGRALDEIGRGRMSASGNFIRRLAVGDVVTIWGKARFPGWVNVVEEVGIDIYWAV